MKSPVMTKNVSDNSLMMPGVKEEVQGSSVAGRSKFLNLREIDNIEEHYKIGEKLGKGAFGTVNRATRLASNTEVALKMITKKSIESRTVLKKLMLNELNVLKDTSHPHIMRVVEIVHDTKYYYIASEILKGGEL